MKINVRWMCPFWTSNEYARGYCRFDGTSCHASGGDNPEWCRKYASLRKLMTEKNIELNDLLMYPEGDDIEGVSNYLPIVDFNGIDAITEEQIEEYMDEKGWYVSEHGGMCEVHDYDGSVIVRGGSRYDVLKKVKEMME